MSGLLTIGEFARVSHVSVKALRHYDDIGLLKPADVDRWSGHRRYASAQVPVAHVIRRFRDLDMPLDQIRLVLAAPDLETRNEVIVEHLARMQQTLEQTQTTVTSLRAMLDGTATSLPVEFRHLDATVAVAITETVAWGDTEAWLAAAFDELHHTVATTPHARSGVDAALYSAEFFEAHRGELVAYIPLVTSARVDLVGRVSLVEIPAVDVALTLHTGPFSEIDRAYGTLGTYITEHVIGAPGPIRERYLIVPEDAAHAPIEICWPIRRNPSFSVS